MTWLQRWATAAPAPVFVAVGRDARERVEDLFLAPGFDSAASPRHASVLLVAGEIRAEDRERLYRLHDQLPHPRATLWWGGEVEEAMRGTMTVPVSEDPRSALDALYRGLVSGERASEPHLLANEPPNPWRGRGDHGQGGEGMMGGTPYGRPMPMPPQQDRRDGLALDAYTVRIGPFLPTFPPGLVLEVTLQGDVFQSCRVIRAPFPAPDSVSAPFLRALSEPVSLAQLERARAAHHLRCVARLLLILELIPWAERCRRTARAIEGGETADLAALRKALTGAGAFAAIPVGLGRLDEQAVKELGGVAGRAAGVAGDARGGQAWYRAHGFRTLTRRDGDVRARLAQWLDEAEQALRLADGAGAEQQLEPGDAVESPWGRLSAQREQPALAFSFTDLLAGREWRDAMLVIASFDVASLSRMSPAEDEDSDEAAQ